METNLALVITTIKLAQNSLVSSAIFDESIKSKIIQNTFIAVLCDRSTDSAVVEKENICFVHGSRYLPPNIVISLSKNLPSQDTDGIVKAIKRFSIQGLRHLLPKMVLIASDEASVNSGLKGGIATKLREEEYLFWLSFIWCLSHRLKCAISDSLHEHLSPLKQFLCNLFYLYEKSSRKLKELCVVHETLKNIYEFQNKQVKPTNPTVLNGLFMRYKAWLVLLSRSEFTSNT